MRVPTKKSGRRLRAGELAPQPEGMGHRIAKHILSPGDGGTLEKSIYYILDAQGNVMSTYERVINISGTSVSYTQTEKHIYGSSRLGVHNERIELLGTLNDTYSMANIQHRIGDKTYELSNHLGNVLSVISDKVIPHINGSSVDYFLADLRQATDYSPFGVKLHNRDLPLTSGSGTSVPYRYGFNGMEKDNEVYGEGNSYTAEFWQYDARLGKRWNIDPKTRVWHSGYQAFSNNPVINIDPNGDTDFYSNGKWIGTDGEDNGLMAVVNDKNVKTKIVENTANGLYSNYGAMSNGDNNTQFSVIHVDVLASASAVLTKAIGSKSDLTEEHMQTLKARSQQDGGGYAVTKEDSGGKKITDSGGGDRVQGPSVDPSGDITIHSHPVKKNNGRLVSKKVTVKGVEAIEYSYPYLTYNDALQPSTCDVKTGGDMCITGMKMNIIVGKNGANFKTVMENGKAQVQDNRTYNINIFSGNWSLLFTISKTDADKMLNSATNTAAKEAFQKKVAANNSSTPNSGN